MHGNSAQRTSTAWVRLSDCGERATHSAAKDLLKSNGIEVGVGQGLYVDLSSGEGTPSEWDTEVSCFRTVDTENLANW